MRDENLWQASELVKQPILWTQFKMRLTFRILFCLLQLDNFHLLHIHSTFSKHLPWVGKIMKIKIVQLPTNSFPCLPGGQFEELQLFNFATFTCYLQLYTCSTVFTFNIHSSINSPQNVSNVDYTFVYNSYKIEVTIALMQLLPLKEQR